MPDARWAAEDGDPDLRAALRLELVFAPDFAVVFFLRDPVDAFRAEVDDRDAPPRRADLRDEALREALLRDFDLLFFAAMSGSPADERVGMHWV